MGFPSVYYCVILPKPLILVIQLLDSLRHAMFLSLFYLGLAPSVEDYYALPPLSTAATATAIATATATATPPPLSPPVTPSAIKARLRTVRFASSSKIPSSSSSAAAAAAAAEFGEEPMCAVCLGPLKAKDEVRELGGCYHVFHKGCIDKWVDMGQVTCPLCRAFLLPN